MLLFSVVLFLISLVYDVANLLLAGQITLNSQGRISD